MRQPARPLPLRRTTHRRKGRGFRSLPRHTVGRERQLLCPMRASEARAASSARCCTHRISRFYRQGVYAMLMEFLSAIGHRLRPRWVLTIPPESLAFQLISPMTREVAATFLPHPASKNTAIHFRGTPDSSKREVIGESPQDRRKQ